MISGRVWDRPVRCWPLGHRRIGCETSLWCTIVAGSEELRAVAGGTVWPLSAQLHSAEGNKNTKTVQALVFLPFASIPLPPRVVIMTFALHILHLIVPSTTSASTQWCLLGQGSQML